MTFIGYAFSKEHKKFPALKAMFLWREKGATIGQCKDMHKYWDPLTEVPMSFLTTTWKVSENVAFSSPYFPVFGPEKTPYLDTFHAVHIYTNSIYYAFTTYLLQCLLSGFTHAERRSLTHKVHPVTRDII